MSKDTPTRQLPATPLSRDRDLDAIAKRINKALSKTIEGIFETGKLLADARAALDHGQWLRLFRERRVLMSDSTARRFIEIYHRRDALLSNRAHVHDLPPSWATLYELARLPNDTLAWAHEHGRITPDLQRKDVADLRTQYADDTVPVTREPARPDPTRVARAITQRLNRVLPRLSGDARVLVIAEVQRTLDRFATQLDPDPETAIPSEGARAC